MSAAIHYLILSVREKDGVELYFIVAPRRAFHARREANACEWPDYLFERSSEY
jgi:hypothetical protein